MKKTKELKNIVFWEELEKNSPNSYKQWFNVEKEYIKKIVTKNSVILDIGCGNGRTLYDILDVTNNVFGIDNEEKAVEDTRKNLSMIDKSHFLLANAKNLPFEDKKFDFVFCMGTFANFGEIKFKALEEMKRVLKDNGSIILTVFCEDAFEERMKVYKNLNAPIKEIKGTTVFFNFETEGENISEQFSKKDLELITKKVNLKILHIEKTGIIYIVQLGK